jgi:hypothetical protein
MATASGSGSSISLFEARSVVIIVPGVRRILLRERVAGLRIREPTGEPPLLPVSRFIDVHGVQPSHQVFGGAFPGNSDAMGRSTLVNGKEKYIMAI